MVVAASGIDRDYAALGIVGAGQRIVLRSVIDAQHDDGARLWPKGPRVAAPRSVPGEPAHVAMISALDKFAQTGAGAVGQMRRREADRVEPDRQRLGADSLADVGGSGSHSHFRDVVAARAGTHLSTIGLSPA